MIKTDKVIYRARTREEYDWLMEKLEADGFKWITGELPTAPDEYDLWGECLSETCIDFEDKMIAFADFTFYNCSPDYENYEFIEVSDIMEKK